MADEVLCTRLETELLVNRLHRVLVEVDAYISRLSLLHLTVATRTHPGE